MVGQGRDGAWNLEELGKGELSGAMAPHHHPVQPLPWHRSSTWPQWHLYFCWYRHLSNTQPQWHLHFRWHRHLSNTRGWCHLQFNCWQRQLRISWTSWHHLFTHDPSRQLCYCLLKCHPRNQCSLNKMNHMTWNGLCCFWLQQGGPTRVYHEGMWVCPFCHKGHRQWTIRDLLLHAHNIAISPAWIWDTRRGIALWRSIWSRRHVLLHSVQRLDFHELVMVVVWVVMVDASSKWWW
jgi:hypothetical protein